MTLQLASYSSESAAYQLRIEEAFEIDADEKGRVLIVDDSPTVRSVFLNTLEKNYDCVTAGSYEEAVDFLKRFPIDLAIVDVLMPGLSGNELLRKIVTTYPETTVIMASGVDRPQGTINSLKQGAFDYLIKPCELPVLELAVERAFQHRSLQRRAETYKKRLEARNHDLELGRAHLDQLQSKLVQNEKMVGLGQLAAGVAHELNNPVAFVHGNLDILHQTTKALVNVLKFYESAELPSHIEEHAAVLKAAVPYLSTIDDLDTVITDCKDGAGRIKDIVQNLRTFSRLDEADFKKIDVHPGIEATIRLLSQHFVGGNIELVKDFGEIPAIDAFGSQLNQVWMNLLVNAAQSLGGQPGSVRVTTRSDDEFVTVAIADTGDGIAKQDLGRIFEPFYTTKPIGEGTGLGLSICFGIVERHGGAIFAASELRAGTAFTVRLPITQTEPIPAQTGIILFEKSNTHSERI